MIRNRLDKLRELMAKYHIDAYIVPSEDFHDSEYVSEYFMARKYMSGFTGSAGILIITMEEAGLWTDGRYFIQAANQLKGSTINLYKMEEDGVPTTIEFLKDKLKQNARLGFDGRVINANYGARLEKALKNKEISIVYDTDLVDLVWEDRPSLSKEPAFLLDLKYAGKSFLHKLQDLREKTKKKGATSHIITSLDDIAWLFNIRGNDVPYNPVLLSYALISLDQVYLFLDKDKLSEDSYMSHLVNMPYSYFL